MVRTARQPLPGYDTEIGQIVMFRDTDKMTGDLEGALDSYCILFQPKALPKISWNCLSMFKGTLKGESIEAVFTVWQADARSNVRKLELMQGTKGLTGVGTYSGPRDGIRTYNFQYRFCEPGNEEACAKRMGY